MPFQAPRRCVNPFPLPMARKSSVGCDVMPAATMLIQYTWWHMYAYFTKPWGAAIFVSIFSKQRGQTRPEQPCGARAVSGVDPMWYNDTFIEYVHAYVQVGFCFCFPLGFVFFLRMDDG